MSIPTEELALMQRIRAQYGEAIRQAVAGTEFPESLLAALIANESGGDMAAKRLEPFAFTELALVLVRRKAEFNGIGALDLAAHIDSGLALPPYGEDVLQAIAKLMDLATSWGITQIMGWHVVKDSHVTLKCLVDGEEHLKFAVVLLDDFAREFHLDAGGAQAPFFHCWNTGKPNLPTADAKYVPNGLARMQLYENLPAEPAEQHA